MTALITLSTFDAEYLFLFPPKETFIGYFPVCSYGRASHFAYLANIYMCALVLRGGRLVQLVKRLRRKPEFINY